MDLRATKVFHPQGKRHTNLLELEHRVLRVAAAGKLHALQGEHTLPLPAATDKDAAARASSALNDNVAAH